MDPVLVALLATRGAGDRGVREQPLSAPIVCPRCASRRLHLAIEMKLHNGYAVLDFPAQDPKLAG